MCRYSTCLYAMSSTLCALFVSYQLSFLSVPSVVIGVQGAYPYVVWNPPEEPNGIITNYSLTFTCCGLTNTITTINDWPFYVVQPSDCPCSSESINITVSFGLKIKLMIFDIHYLRSLL